MVLPKIRPVAIYMNLLRVACDPASLNWVGGGAVLGQLAGGRYWDSWRGGGRKKRAGRKYPTFVIGYVLASLFCINCWAPGQTRDLCQSSCKISALPANRQNVGSITYGRAAVNVVHGFSPKKIRHSIPHNGPDCKRASDQVLRIAGISRCPSCPRTAK